MTEQPQFTIRVDQNKYLPMDGTEVHAVLTVEAAGPVERLAQEQQAAEVIIVDTSGSMSYGKINEARKAAMAAVDTLRDGVHFAIVSGTAYAHMVFPHDRHLVPADRGSREAAKAAISRMEADGGTAIGRWLRLAADLFQPFPHAIKHAILLTDGKNEHQDAREFDADLAYCTGKFVCDCRGVGDGWVVAELRKIASALLGTVGDIPDPKDLEADFRAMTQTAMGKAVADVVLRVRTPQNASLKFLKQVSPTLEDLTARRAASGPLDGDYPTGSWGAESREYHLAIQVQPGTVGQEMRAAWVRVMVPDTGAQLAAGNVLAEWSADPVASTRINPRVAHYTGQQELAQLIQDGLQARKDGDLELATARLGRARGIAQQSGNGDTAKLLDRVIDFDPESGTARLKPDVEKAAEIALDTGSVRTARMRKEPQG
ncbi:VWA domain-containing protein [Spongiactinospora sp. 9N601]|uniref:VWA domain-containing protein n=1 Tax=Spongiactinospora sp. 9N601 TaxID=3375149 RepID=UPI0037913B0F